MRRVRRSRHSKAKAISQRLQARIGRCLEMSLLHGVFRVGALASSFPMSCIRSAKLNHFNQDWEETASLHLLWFLPNGLASRVVEESELSECCDYEGFAFHIRS